MRFKNSTLWKYLLSYLAVLVLSFLGFYLILNIQLKNEYIHTYNEEVEQKLSNYSVIVTQHFSDITRIDEIINNNPILISARYVDDNYQRYLAVNELKNLSNANALVSSIIYIDVKNDDILASNHACYYADDYFYIKTTDGDILIPQELITSTTYDNTIYPITTHNSTMYVFLCPRNSMNYRTIYILNGISLRTLSSLYVSQEISAVGFVCQDTLVYFTDTQVLPMFDFKSQEIPHNSFISLDDKNDLYLLETSNPKMNITVCINKAFLNDYITTIFAKTHLITSLLFLLGIVLVFFALKATYFPLSKLMKGIARDNAYEISDIDALGRAFDDSANAKMLLESKLAHYQRMIKKAVVQGSSLPNFAAELDDCINILFQEDFRGSFLITIITFEDGLDPMQIDLSSFADKEITLARLDCNENRATLLVCFTSDTEDATTDALKLFGRIQDTNPCRIAYSDISTNPTDIAYLYFLAQLAQKYAGPKSLCSYASIRSFVDNQAAASYPYQIIDALALHLRHFDFENAHTTVDEIVRFVDTANSPTIFTRCILVDALMCLNTEMNACSVKFENYKDLFQKTLHLCRYAPYETNKDTIQKNMHQIILVFSDEASNVGINMQQILRFVEANCLRSNFSLTLLAEHFHVSSVYLSTLFTQKLQVTFSDYVWKCRSDAAKVLLETTDKPIDQICASVGYDIPSSFRRKFKQEVGMSPSEYRKQYHSQ